MVEGVFPKKGTSDFSASRSEEMVTTARYRRLEIFITKFILLQIVEIRTKVTPTGRSKPTFLDHPTSVPGSRISAPMQDDGGTFTISCSSHSPLSHTVLIQAQRLVHFLLTSVSEGDL